MVTLNLFVAIQTCRDLAAHWLANAGWDMPGTYADVFAALTQHAVIPRELATRLAAAAAFRNLVAHQYGALDWRRRSHRLGSRRRRRLLRNARRAGAWSSVTTVAATFTGAPRVNTWPSRTTPGHLEDLMIGRAGKSDRRGVNCAVARCRNAGHGLEGHRYVNEESQPVSSMVSSSARLAAWRSASVISIGSR